MNESSKSSRREFIKTVTSSTVAASAAPAILKASTPESTPTVSASIKKIHEWDPVAMKLKL